MKGGDVNNWKENNFLALAVSNEEMARLAARSTASCSGRLIWSGIQMSVKWVLIELRVNRVRWIRSIRRCDLKVFKSEWTEENESLRKKNLHIWRENKYLIIKPSVGQCKLKPCFSYDVNLMTHLCNTHRWFYFYIQVHQWDKQYSQSILVLGFWSG